MKEDNVERKKTRSNSKEKIRKKMQKRTRDRNEKEKIGNRKGKMRYSM